ncbi:MAG: outer rane lipoprotein carrier protein LolA [Pseudomonadota bacterium]|jgi:outer membrane lipoprotein carrier protein
MTRRVAPALIALVALAAWLGAVRADSLETLGQFLQGTRSARAEFTQTVQLPPRDGQAQRPKVSNGLFAFQRPARFRFEYQRPYPQLLLGDGTTLWVYDVDLAQVTARPQDKALASTPVALIAAATDLTALQRDFQLLAQPEQDGLHWVQATPRSREAGVQSLRVGLRPGERGVAMERLEIVDAMGQRSLLQFTRIEINPPGLGAAAFQFTPPPKVEVIRP